MDESRLSTVLQEAVPDPDREFTFSQPTRSRWVAPGIAVGMTVVVASAIVGAGFLRGGHDDQLPLPRGPSPLATGCPETRPYPPGFIAPAASYRSEVYLFDRSYVQAGVVRERALRSELGRKLATVNCDLGEIYASDRQMVEEPRNGNATLPVGTPLYSAGSFTPPCRIAAVVDGSIATFVLEQDPRQTTLRVPCGGLPTQGPTGSSTP